MASEAIGISIGLSLRGISELFKLKSSFEKLNSAIVKSGLEVSKFNKDLEAIKSLEDKKLALKLERANLKDELLQVGNLLKGAVFTLPVKLAIDFESSMADVKKVVDFESKEELKEFSNEILKLSREIPLNAKELAQITASGGQLGIAKNELIAYTTLVAKMGVAFDMSAEVAGESLSNLKNSLQLNINEVEKLGDTINHLSDNSASKASKIVEAISRVGGTARIFNLSADQTAALASSFISLGKAPEVAANSINALLNKLMTAPQQGEKFQKALKQIGMDSKYLKVAIEKDPQKALNTFFESLEKVKDSEKMAVLTNLFGTEYADDMALMLTSLNEYKKAQDLINDEKKQGSLDREFKNRSETTANSLILLKNAFEEIAINLGSVFLPAISGVVKGFGGFLNSVVDLMNAIPGLTSVVSYAAASFLLFRPAFLIFKIGKSYVKGLFLDIQKIVKVLKIKIALFRSLNIVQSLNNSLAATGAGLKKAYNIAVVSLSRAFNFLKISVLSGATAFKVLKFALISTGIGAIVVAIGMAAAYLIENWDSVKEFFSNFWQGIKEKWEAISSFFAELFFPVVEAWNSLFGGWFDWIGEKLSWLFAGIGKIASFTSNLLGFENSEPTSDLKQDVSYNNLELFSQPKAQVVANASSGANTVINVTFSGDFSLFASNNGKFDLESFKQQIVSATKEALRKEQFNRANTSIKG